VYSGRWTHSLLTISSFGFEIQRFVEMHISIFTYFSTAQMLFSKLAKRLLWVSSLNRFVFLEGLSRLVVRFHVPSTM
jgi:hypothetical protein